MSNNKQEPQKCEAKMCCKATAKLENQIAEELVQLDQSLDELLKAKKQEEDEDKDTE